MNLLATSSRRYLLAHRWQFGLSIVGVALGVAVVVSVDLANGSAQRAFELSRDAVTGNTTHQIVGGPGGVPEAIYTRLRTGVGIRRVAPVVEGFVLLPRGDPAGDARVNAGDAEFRRPLRLLGVDPFSEAPFRARLHTGPAQIDLTAFLTGSNAVLMSRATAQHIGVGVGETFDADAGGRQQRILVAGLIDATGSDSEALGDLLVTDIATAQRLLGSAGTLSRIDMIFDETVAGDELLARVRDALPDSVRLVNAAARTETMRQMTRAFRVNLTALSLLALVCGIFLVYNTMSFSVVQRRQMIGTMRAIGVTRREVFGLLIVEAVAIGVAGTVLGTIFGIGIGRLLVSLVTQTINDLYFVVSVSAFTVAPSSLLKGLLLGVGGSVVAALFPAFEATGAPPRAVLMRSPLEARARRRSLPAAMLGIALLLVGALILALSGRNLVFSFAALFVMILGFALMTPAAVVVAMRAAAYPMGWFLGPIGRIAARGVVASLSRTAVAIAALTIAVSVTIGVGIMIDSFRGTVIRWLDSVLVADLYVTPLGRVPLTLDAATRARLLEIPGAQRINTVRSADLPTADGGRTQLMVFDLDARGEAGFSFASGDPGVALTAFRTSDSILVSEPYAYRHDVDVGASVELLTDRGPRRFTVAGVYYNYASEEGLVAMSRATYERHWDDRAISGFSVYLDADTDLAATTAEIRRALAGHDVQIQANRALRQAALEVFDRTFLITGVLRLLVTLVAVIGVLSALLSLQLERAWEVGVLRALGLTPAEVWWLNSAQCGLMGLVSGVLALPVGLALAAVMIFVINRRSFGWSLDMEIDPAILGQALVLALLAALVAGVYPSYRMSRTRPAVALREE